MTQIYRISADFFQLKNRRRKVCILIILLILITIGTFTQIFPNTWCLLTCNGYFIPKESNIFIFRATKMSEGSGEMWLYGEDCNFYHRLNVEPNYTPTYFKLKKEKKPEDVRSQKVLREFESLSPERRAANL